MNLYIGSLYAANSNLTMWVPDTNFGVSMSWRAELIEKGGSFIVTMVMRDELSHSVYILYRGLVGRLFIDSLSAAAVTTLGLS